MNEAVENGSSLWPIIIFAVYWTYLVITYEQHKRDWFKAFFDPNGSTPDAAAREGIGGSSAAVPATLDGLNENIFLTCAAPSYEFIVKNYAAGNMTELVGLLSPDVLEVFSMHVEARKARGEKLALDIVTLSDVRIVARDTTGTHSEFKVRFEAEIVASEPVSDPSKPPHHRPHLLNAVDIWTFQKRNRGSNPNWTLVATEAG
ncbi:Tim44/TimA family putative adaptor protein [Hoeflea sp.]|uniref:Tim44/TimA family putative adaptor protein n=1 Tax=Hoeflea sp. TaxID=1940281 RepID=UPI002B003CD9|nr:Tim44/TimA family putative adaptor protein [Hoeflea sp.]